MANIAEATDIPASTYVDATSRYLGSSVIYYGPQKKITFTTYKRKPPQISNQDRFGVVTTPYRPDLVSFKVYGVPHYWWVIMQFNGIYDIFDFKAGITIRLPVFL